MVGVKTNVLRLMSFNTWRKGKHIHGGFDKIIQHVRTVNPDIVAFQELDIGAMHYLLKAFGDEWSGIQNDHGHFPTGILTKHSLNVHSKITLSSNKGVGCDITINWGGSKSKVVHIWSVHLDSSHYGPYYALNPKFESNWQEFAYDKSARIAETKELLNLLPKDSLGNEDSSTLIIGDFNEPSHLDWIPEAKQLHGNRSFDWPVSKIMSSEGFQDVYRILNPSPVESPGNTWSPIFKNVPESGYAYQDRSQSEPQDRIDFIYYKSKYFMPISVSLYMGNGHNLEIPHHIHNDWPSDHFSIIADFHIV